MKMVIYKPRRQAEDRPFPHSSQKELLLPTPWSRTYSSPQKWEAIDVPLFQLLSLRGFVTANQQTETMTKGERRSLLSTVKGQRKKKGMLLCSSGPGLQKKAQQEASLDQTICYHSQADLPLRMVR